MLFKIKILLFCFLILALNVTVFGQGNIIPPSPEVENFVKFIDNPVNFQTGACDLKIPLYEIKCGELSLPISLNYHTTGRKTYEMNGPVGLEWLLNTGGMISRTVYGIRDDDVWNFPTPFPSPGILTNKNNYNFLARVNKTPSETTHYDTQYDIFTYNFGGTSGNFILKDVNNVKVPEVIPNRDLKIYAHKVLTPHPMFDYIEITDENGVFYRFGKSIQSGSSYIENTGDYTSAWFVSEIISANKQDTISFKYTTVGKIRMSYSQLITVRDQNNVYSGTGPFINDQNSQEITNQLAYASTRISEIVYKNGKVTFEKEPNSDLISKMTVYSNSGPLKSITFSKSILDSPVGLYTFSISDQMNYKLDKVIFLDKNNSLIDQYLFEYFPSSDFNVRHNDWWGYYNGSTANPYYLIPRYTIPFKNSMAQPMGTTEIGNIEANRTPGAQYAQFGILKSVTYPTGGKTEFFYENNKYKSIKPGGTISDCGGLRISKTITTENTGIANVKTYKYGENELGYGYINYEPEIGLFGYEQSQIKFGGSGGWWGCYINGFGPYDFLRIRYYSSDVLPEYSRYFNSPVMYPKIIVYEGETNSNIGKTVYKYETNRQYLADYSFNMEAPVEADRDYSINRKHEKMIDLWRQNELIEKSVFDGNNKKLRMETYNYLSTPKEEIGGMHLERFYSYTTADYGSNDYDYEACAASYEQPVYIFDSYSVSSGVKQLQNTTVSNYSGLNDSIKELTNYEYNQTQLLRKFEKVINNGSITTFYYYPNDYNSSPNFSALINSNIIGKPIDSRTYKGNRLISGSQTKFDSYGQATDIYNFESSDVDIPFSPGIPYTFTHKSGILYNANNRIKQTVPDNNISTYYGWSYNNQYPVVKIESNNNTIAIDQIQTVMSGLSLSGNNDKLSIDSDISQLKAVITANVSLSDVVTYYTYTPLIGLTSQTDPNGKTTYYEYDDFGRLKFTKDDQGKILKKIDYHYSTSN